MRRLVALLLCCVLLCSSAFAVTTGYSPSAGDSLWSYSFGGYIYNFQFSSDSSSNWSVHDFSYLIDVLGATEQMRTYIATTVTSNYNNNISEFPLSRTLAPEDVLVPFDIIHYTDYANGYKHYWSLMCPFLVGQYLSNDQVRSLYYHNGFQLLFQQPLYDGRDQRGGAMNNVSTINAYSNAAFLCSGLVNNGSGLVYTPLILFELPATDNDSEHIQAQLATIVQAILAIKNSTLSFNEEMLDKVSGLRESVTGINNMILQIMGDVGKSAKSLDSLVRFCSDIFELVNKISLDLDKLVTSTANIEVYQSQILDFLIDSIDSDIMNIYYSSDKGFKSVLESLNGISERLGTICTLLPDILAEMQKTNVTLNSVHDLLAWMKKNWPDPGDYNQFNDFFVGEGEDSTSFFDIFKSIFAAIRSVFVSLFGWFVKPIIDFALTVPDYISSAFSVFNDDKGGGDLW